MNGRLLKFVRPTVMIRSKTAQEFFNGAGARALWLDLPLMYQRHFRKARWIMERYPAIEVRPGPRWVEVYGFDAKGGKHALRDIDGRAEERIVDWVARWCNDAYGRHLVSTVGPWSDGKKYQSELPDHGDFGALGRFASVPPNSLHLREARRRKRGIDMGLKELKERREKERESNLGWRAAAIEVGESETLYLVGEPVDREVEISADQARDGEAKSFTVTDWPAMHSLNEGAVDVFQVSSGLLNDALIEVFEARKPSPTNPVGVKITVGMKGKFRDFRVIAL